MPVLAAYTYWSVEQSNVYTNELKQSARAVTSGVAPAVDEEVIAQEWNKIGDTFRKLNAEGTRSALLHKDGTLWYSLPDFPADAVAAARVQLAQRKSEEFGPTTGARSWFCELVPLKGESGHVIGYLLEVQDWTKAARDIQAQSIASVIVAIVLMGIVATVIPLTVNRYVSRPLADLSAKVMKFSADDSGRSAGSEVELLGEEFRRLDQQPASARAGTRAGAAARGSPRHHRRLGGGTRARDRHADGRDSRARGRPAAGSDNFGGGARKAGHHRAADRSRHANSQDAARLRTEERVAHGDLRSADDR